MLYGQRVIVGEKIKASGDGSHRYDDPELKKGMPEQEEEFIVRPTKQDSDDVLEKQVNFDSGILEDKTAIISGDSPGGWVKYESNAVKDCSEYK